LKIRGRFWQEAAGSFWQLRKWLWEKFLVAVYKEINPYDGFVITAFLTRRIKQLEKKVVVWPRQ